MYLPSLFFYIQSSEKFFVLEGAKNFEGSKL